MAERNALPQNNQCPPGNSGSPTQATEFYSIGSHRLTGVFSDFSEKHSIFSRIHAEARCEVSQLETDNRKSQTGTSPSEDVPPNLSDMQPNDPGSPFHSGRSFEDLNLPSSQNWTSPSEHVPLNLEEARNEVSQLETDNRRSQTGTSPSEDVPPNLSGMQQNDPGSALYSGKSLEVLNLSDALFRGLCEMGFCHMSILQEIALRIILADPPTNLIVQSWPGAGKTAALVLSMLRKVDAAQNFTQVICLLPTYELACQTGRMAEKMGKYWSEVKIGYALGGEVPRDQAVTDHILFGTPDALLDWISQHRVIDPRKIKMFVLDVAEAMIAEGHRNQCGTIHNALPKSCQMLLSSATSDEEVMEFAKSVVPNPFIIKHFPEEILDNIKKYDVVCHDKEDKFQALSDMYGVESIGQCIIFCQTREEASWLVRRMTKQNHTVAFFSSKMTGEQRVALLDGFRDGNERLLITNVPLWGIYFKAVTHVVNYDMPVDFETYLHRIGRTGSFGKSGTVVNFTDISDRWRP